MRLGVHVSTEGGIFEALTRADKLGCSTMQIFSRSPRMWKGPGLKSEAVAEFIRRRMSLDIEPIFIHEPYLINLASPDPALYQDSIDAYIEDIRQAALLGAEYIVTHMGSHKDTSEEAGLKRLAAAMEKIIAQTASLQVGILLENTAGGGSSLGYNFRHHGQIIKDCHNSLRLGICLDTAHAYAAGYDISSCAGWDSLLQEIDNSVGLSRLKLIHLNDTQVALGSHRDLHEHIAKGNIGVTGMRCILRDRRLRDCAFILETPKNRKMADRLNLRRVKKIYGS